MSYTPAFPGIYEALRRMGPSVRLATRWYATMRLPEEWDHDMGPDFWEAVICAWDRYHGHLDLQDLPWKRRSRDEVNTEETLTSAQPVIVRVKTCG